MVVLFTALVAYLFATDQSDAGVLVGLVGVFATLVVAIVQTVEAKAAAQDATKSSESIHRVLLEIFQAVKKDETVEIEITGGGYFRIHYRPKVYPAAAVAGIMEPGVGTTDPPKGAPDHEASSGSMGSPKPNP